ncbi:potassium transporter Kup [Chiayiivirga flava]|uniref:Probable potassium transport system protein Kup n=1 Tax=Chiayiivirga flava TaxID=659595 RepID=A0A7W8FYA0_9GAMM|nr:potassium transporter Kup [Chiayiivirga flava]MBB5207172.1 KUP system potassium uptake protein [Chiayiivirga flava]
MHATDSKVSPRALVLGAIGVVFGDIGTSPLYTLREAFGEVYGLEPDRANVLGVLSLVFWAMMLIVTVKYVLVILRADNRGEGGILALMAVVQRTLPVASPTAYTVGLLGVLGTALFFGDAVITPAMTTLSAVEGLRVAAPGLEPYIIPVTLVVLLCLFGFQRFGTERVGKVFGPVMLLWFVIIGLLGAIELATNPRILEALNPVWAVRFFAEHGVAAWLSLGAIVLAVTGGEALYADMGHFGRVPIRNAWMTVVMPALVLNYFGQGALVLARPDAVHNPFFELVPSWGLYPMIVLATLAAVIASQAVISGAFSLARQAIQLGYLPRLKLVHTSHETIGQIYIPWVNRLLLLAVIALVLGFGSSSNLAIAYGVSVSGSMLIDTLLLVILATQRGRIPMPVIVAVGLFYFVVDSAFFSANASKFLHGAWFPLVLALAVFTLMRTWRRGRQLVRAKVDRESLRLGPFLQSLMLSPPVRVPGTAVFLTPSNQFVPPALLHNLKHNKVLHERNVILSIETLNIPRADAGERVHFVQHDHGFSCLTLRFGYMEDHDVPFALRRWEIPGEAFEPLETTFFVSRESLSARAGHGMALWRDRLFLFMSRNAAPATEFFSIPGNRLVELGTQVEI